MTFVQPAGLWLLGLIPVILLIHLLRSNPRRQPVPSAFLWRGLDHEQSASRRFRPPRPSWLLLLQLLGVAVLALAVANPRVTGLPSRHLFVLVDASASMLATDVPPSRAQAAIEQAAGLLGELGAQDRATLIRVGPRPSVVADNVESGVAQAALSGLEAGAGSASMREALLLVNELARRSDAPRREAVVLTDGAIVDPGDLGRLNLPIRYQIVGRSTDNQAVTSVQVSRQPRPEAGLAGLARLVNFADRPVRLPVRVMGDGLLLETRDVEIPSRGRTTLAFSVPDGTRRVSVTLPGRDAMPADDLVDIAVDAGQARQVLVVSRLPEALERALKAIPDLRVQTVSPESYTGAGAELVVLDGFLPERLPPGQLLIVNPPPGRPYLPVTGELRSVQVTDFDARHPLLQAVDLSAVRLGRAAALEPPDWARTVVESQGRPLIAEGRESGRSVVIFAFDPINSGVDKLIAFPLLVSNAVAFLSGGELTPSLPPARSATLAVAPEVSDVRLELPNGTVRAPPVQGGLIRLEGLELPGRYVVRERGRGATAEPRIFTINVADEAESDISPRQRPALQAAVPASDEPTPGPTELWPALLALGLVVFGAEWWRFGRRG